MEKQVIVHVLDDRAHNTFLCQHIPEGRYES